MKVTRSDWCLAGSGVSSTGLPNIERESFKVYRSVAPSGVDDGASTRGSPPSSRSSSVSSSGRGRRPDDPCGLVAGPGRQPDDETDDDSDGSSDRWNNSHNSCLALKYRDHLFIGPSSSICLDNKM